MRKSTLKRVGAQYEAPISPIILAQSGVASSVTGTLTETTLASVTIPAGMMGPNGSVRIVAQFSNTNSANTKNLRIKFGGVVYSSAPTTTQITTSFITEIYNAGAINSQVGGHIAATTGNFGSSNNATPTSTLDTNADQIVTFTGENGNAGEIITLKRYRVEVLPG